MVIPQPSQTDGGSVTVLGATGSIGRSTLAVLERNPGRPIHALTAHSRVEELAQLCLRHRPRHAVVAEEAGARRMQRLLKEGGCSTEAHHGPAPLAQVAAEADTVIAAIVGIAGLVPTLAAVKAGRRVLLANKEALVAAGELFMAAAAESGAELLPVDSEHNAIFQCLAAVEKDEVEKVVLTASGGPFLGYSRRRLRRVTPDQACAHPNWSMGRKISVDSATMMNKGLELIEACLLFRLPPPKVEVLVHPQSIVHSLVYCKDGSVLAQLARPDMRVPIAAALDWPRRLDSGAAGLDLAALGRLDFQAPDPERFPCLALGRRAAEQGGTVPAAVNAANETAVQAFLDGHLPFLGIPEIIAEVMAIMTCEPASTLAIIEQADRRARELAAGLIRKIG